MLEQLSTYEPPAPKTEEVVRDIRSMGIATGLFLIAVLGDDGQDVHPHPRERFQILFDAVGNKPVKWFWLYAAVLLMGAIELRGGEPSLSGLRIDYAGISALAKQL